MNTEIESPESVLPAADFSAIKVTIIYEDFASGVRAKNFAEQLAEQLGTACHLSESFWRADLLANEQIATEANRTAADFDYLIISMRGDRILPLNTCDWIEAHLDSAASRGAAMVVLPDQDQGKWRIVEATRQQFRFMCVMKGVAFFSHGMTPPADDALPDECRGDEAEELAFTAQSETPEWSAPQSANELRNALV